MGGAHRDHAAMAQALKKALQDALRTFTSKGVDELIEARFERLMDYGKFKEVKTE